MQHVPRYCGIHGCHLEASYWIDTNEGFYEQLGISKAPGTFYLCSDHMTQLVNDETGNYMHLRIDTGELHEIEIGGYACSPECEECNS